MGVRLFCRLAIISRTVYNYHSCRDDRAVTMRIREIVETRIRYGCQRIHIQPRCEGWVINHKKTHRIYCQEVLNLRRNRPRRHVSAAHLVEWPLLSNPDQCWSMDFGTDNVFNGRRFRALTVSDNFSRECLAIHAGQSLEGKDVMAVMKCLRLMHNRVPIRIQADNGSEFISKALDRWA